MAQVPGWPACGTEARPWVRSGDEIGSRRALMRAGGDYQAAIPPFTAEAQPVLSPALLSMADDASAELARFDAEAGHMVTPFASILLRTESASSSEVENLTSSAKQVALAELGASDSGNAKLVVANVRVMRAALWFADEITTDAIIQMQQALLHESAPDYTGKFRDQQVWIGGGSISPHAAMFVPPHQDRVPELMDDLVAFCQRTDIPALIHAAIAHAQFETIHPFPDGNGRTGRALVHSLLKRAGLTRNISVPVSAGILRDTNRYFNALSAYREGSLEEIVEVFSDAVFAAVSNSRELALELETITERWALIPTRRGSAALALKELLIEQPVVTVKLVAKELRVSSVAAQNAIDTLGEGGALKQTNNGKRNRIWHSPEVLGALDRFGARARRR